MIAVVTAVMENAIATELAVTTIASATGLIKAQNKMLDKTG